MKGQGSITGAHLAPSPFGGGLGWGRLELASAPSPTTRHPAIPTALPQAPCRREGGVSDAPSARMDRCSQTLTATIKALQTPGR